MEFLHLLSWKVRHTISQLMERVHVSRAALSSLAHVFRRISFFVFMVLGALKTANNSLKTATNYQKQLK